VIQNEASLALAADTGFFRKFIIRIFQSTLVLLCAITVILYFQMHAASYYTQYIGPVHKSVTLLFLYCSYSFVLFFILPALYNYFIYGRDLKSIGLCVPDINLKNIALTLAGLLIIVPFAFIFSKYHTFQNYNYGHITPLKFYFMQVVLVPFYYFAEEFFFRGFLFITLWRKIRWHSFWLTDIIFTLAHFGKPGMEILLCIPASVVFNILTLQTRSIFPGMLVHGTMGIMLNVLINPQI
jgi:membrane protease YdiL (CAAX protease family)